VSALNQTDLEPCPACQSLLQVEVFPSVFRKNAPVTSAEVVLIEGASTCFFHGTRKAVLPCNSCGRFLCSLCDCELNGEHFCPQCLETGKTKGKIRSLENRRTLYDTIALHLAILPVALLIFWFLTFITAPAAMFVAIRYWNAPSSIVHRSKMRLVLAMIVATVQIAAWGIGIYLLLRNFNG
jgi:hypothetical protein